MAEATCPFCKRAAEVQKPGLAVVVDDAFPVSPGHRLIVPRDHVERLEQLPEPTWAAVFDLVREEMRRASENGADGVNVGVNSGTAAGQTIGHAHVHVIPRTTGDVPDPRGGVRWVIPDRAPYWRDG